MSGFYRANIDFITAHAVSADKKRYVDSTEAPRHYLDADHYGKKPFRLIPERWKDAVLKFSEDTLNKYGIVPWSIQSNYYWLVKAFKEHDTSRILTTSANLAHYIADAHVPLHLIQNHDGQLTNQNGTHALWESRIPELFANNYNCYTGKARYIESPIKEAFKICRTSFSQADSVLRLQRILNKYYSDDKKFTTELRGKKMVKVYSPQYCRDYQRLMRGMVQRRMRSTVLAVGSFWYSAWVDAGQPDLNKLIKKSLTAAEVQKLNKEEAVFRSGKIAPFDVKP
ncbi:MAG: zinc dependent phospholipase C family protein [Bacteroidota bacterium]